MDLINGTTPLPVHYAEVCGVSCRPLARIPGKAKAMFRILRIDHIVLRVTNLAAMQHFYIAVLGGTLEWARDELGLYQIRLGNALIDLVPVDGLLGRQGGAPPGKEGRNLDHLCLRVEPFDAGAITDWLRRAGCEPQPVAERYGADGLGPSIYLNDPEGNVVELKGPPTVPQDSGSSL